MTIRKIVLCALVIGVAGCNSTPAIAPPFNGERAYQYLKDQVAFGPRVPGTRAWSDCRQYAIRHFREAGLAVDTQISWFDDPYSGQKMPIVNVIASHRSGDKAAKPILLVAHYDSRARADQSTDSARRNLPIDGANDGASGVAILMELAKAFNQTPPGCNVDLLLVDAEDWGKQGDLDYYLLGSKAFAQTGISGRFRFALVLDMVGDAQQEIFREGYSEQYQKPLNDMVWLAAKQLGVTTLHDTVRHSIIDDHLPLNVGGVPTIDIIDFDYPYWHTEHDTPDKCSPQSLANVGRVVEHIVYNQSIWPKN